VKLNVSIAMVGISNSSTYSLVSDIKKKTQSNIKSAPRCEIAPGSESSDSMDWRVDRKLESRGPSRNEVRTLCWDCVFFLISETKE